MDKAEFLCYLKSNNPLKSSFFSGFLLFLVDGFTLILCNFIGFFLVNLVVTSDINFKSFINYSVYIPFILLVFICVGLYPGIMSPHTDDVKKYCGSVFFCTIAIILSIVISDYKENIIFKVLIKDSTNKALCAAFFISFLCSVILLPGNREVAKHIFCRRKWWGVPCVIYQTNNSGEIIINRLLKSKYLGYHPTVIIDSSMQEDEQKFFNNIIMISSKSKLIPIIHKFNVKTAFICDYKDDFSSIMTKYRYTITVSKSQNSFTSTQQIKDIAGIIGFSSIHNLTIKANLIIKRIIDILIILVCSPILIPVFLILIILTKLTSKGPVFYGHKRIGRNHKEFKCWKFRSMCIDADKKLEEILKNNPEMRAEWEKERKFQNDPRVTKFGKFLRKTSLDELPQLFNILCGQMSFVGPRPVTEPELVKYGEYADYVLSVTPGLSGMWQTSGRSDTLYEERISLDTYYIQNWSIWLDIWILIKTVWIVIKGRGAY